MLPLLLVAAALSGHGPVWKACDHASVTRPASIVIACADANLYADHLHWTSWTAASATATGIGHENDCKPYCAAGRFHAYPMTVTLSKPVRCSTDGPRTYSLIEWSWKSAPGSYHAGWQRLTCSFLALKQ